MVRGFVEDSKFYRVVVGWRLGDTDCTRLFFVVIVGIERGAMGVNLGVGVLI